MRFADLLICICDFGFARCVLSDSYRASSLAKYLFP